MLGASGAPAAQTLTVLTTMNFGKVEFTNTTLNGNLTLSPNGAVDYGGNNSSGNGIGTAGQVRIHGTTGSTVNIRCTDTMTVRHTSGASLSFGEVRMSAGTPQTFAAASACRENLDQNVLTHVLNANAAQNIIYIGGRLTTNGIAVQNGMYSTTNSGATEATLRVIYQ
ncbi:MAG: DUF4402 domain-containing protein [Pseudomonadota bacterium]|jgi:hypothetical protein